MVVGFNHNIRHGGELYHVQTEDGGLKNPFIITHLYRGGTILSSKKTAYADILKTDSLGKIVEDLMKEQHKEMLRRLKDGEFDALIAARFGGKPGVAAQERFAPKETAPTRPAPIAAPPTTPVPPPAKPADPPPTEPPRKQESPVAHERSLDDLILSYLSDKDH